MILRDGTTATVRIAQPDDREALRAFFSALSPESRMRRFFSAATPPERVIAAFCDPSEPSRRLTLVVTRLVEGAPRVVAAASYVGLDEKGAAEIAVAVDDRFQGKGLGTLLVERLAVLAARHGIRRFWAMTRPDNRPMIEVFRRSGFVVHERLADGTVEIDLSVEPTEASVARTEMRDRVFTAASLRPFFAPSAVAVIGASRDVTSVGYRVFAALRSHFRGPVYPINPRAERIDSVPAYPDIQSVPGPVELGVVVVPRDRVLGVVDGCAQKGVRGLIVITAGFAENGPEGKALQQELVAKVRGYGMRLIGPNCLGLINTDPSVGLNASFSPIFPPVGGVGMSSQSGALGLAILSLAQARGLGLSTFVSVGNKADVSGNDLLQYWEEDGRTRTILLYLESFGNPRRFARIARRVSRKKPIVCVKAGRTLSGRRAAGSHTAALAGSEAAVEALFRQTGVIRAETLDEMFDIGELLDSQPLIGGRRVAVLTNAGGPGILCADSCEANDLAVPELSLQLQGRLRGFLPAAAALANPVDMIATAGPEEYRRALEILLESAETDAVIVIYVDVGIAEAKSIEAAIALAVSAARAGRGKEKPVLVCWMGESRRVPLQAAGERLPTYVFPEVPGRALGKVAAYANWRSEPLGVFVELDGVDARAGREICRRAVSERGRGWLGVEEARGLLHAFGLPVLAGAVAKSPEESRRLARRLGFPVAAKLASRKIVHKTEVGGVRLNLRDEASVERAFEEIRDLLMESGRLDAMEGVLIQPMVDDGVEVMAGATDDPVFGPVMAFGLGGIHVEILGDVCFRVTPLTDRDAKEMVRGIRGFPLLEGYRGSPPADLAALEELLLRLSRLLEEVPEVEELDLNPIFALPPGHGCRIADARVRVGPP